MKLPSFLIAGATALAVVLGAAAAKAQTVITNVFPDGTYRFQTSPTLSFSVTSTVNITNVSVQLNGTKFVTKESFLRVLTSGGGGVTVSALPSTSLTASVPLSSNVVYSAVITVKDANGAATSYTIASFDTINGYTFEAEDWDYTDTNTIPPTTGLFFDNPQTNAYLNKWSTSGVDVYNTSGDANSHAYRPGKESGAGLETENGANGNDTKRVQYINTGFTDYNISWTSAGNWANYTRTYPAGTYYLYMRASNPNGGTANNAASFTAAGGSVTLASAPGSTGAAPYRFNVPSTGNWQVYTDVPLTDSSNALVTVTFDGTPAKLQMAENNGGFNANYFLLVPTNANASTPANATVSNVYPNGTNQFQYTNKLVFAVSSPVGVNASDITVQLNGTSLTGQSTQQVLTVSSGLSVVGSLSSWNVSAPLSTNYSYTAFIQVSDVNGGSLGTNIIFDTVYPNYYTFEAEDFNYGGGQFFDNPQTNAYYDATAGGAYDGVSGVDYVNGSGSVSGTYLRFGLNTENAGDVWRPQYGATNDAYPGYGVLFQDFDCGNAYGGNWANYTRTFPAGVYNIYMRAANGNGANADSASMGLVTSDPHQGGQTVGSMGKFAVPNTGAWQKYTWVVLKNAAGYPVQFTGGGVKTLRVTTDGGSYNANYYMLVPADTSLQTPPFMTDFKPDGTQLQQMTNKAAFTANSMPGITLSGVSVKLNGVDVSSSLTSGGSPNVLTVNIPVKSNKLYTAVVTLTDAYGSSTTTNKFDTFDPNALVVEAEDYDYTASPGVAGQFFDFGSPVSSYNGLGSTLDIDEHDDNHAGGAYRAFPPGLEIEDAGDIVRPAYNGTGKTDHNLGFNDGGNWANYTRTYPAGIYNIYMRSANPNTAGTGTQLNAAAAGIVTSGWNTTGQTVTNYGTFSVPYSGGWHTFAWAPLVDASGGLAKVPFTGTTNTLRISVNNGNYNNNFYIIVPADLTIPTIANLYPNGTSYFQSAGGLSFTANSSAGINTNSIVVTVNGVVATNLVFSGSSTSWNVTAPLAPNAVYTTVVTVTTQDGQVVSSTNSFDTFSLSNYQLEAEDYDYNGGHFFDGLVSAYLGLPGVSNIDYVEPDGNAATGGSFIYRPIGIPAGTNDVRGSRPQFTTGKTNYNIGYFGDGAWANYTRTYPGGTYNVYGWLAEGQTNSQTALSLVTSGYGTTNQTISPIGTFHVPVVGWQSWSWIPLVDGNSNLAKVSFDGTQSTLRLAGVAGFPGVNVDFLMLTPTTPAPVLKAVSNAGSASLSVYTQTGYSYQLQYKNDLSAASWTSVGSPVAGNNTIQNLADPSSGSAGQRFYRVQISVTPP